MKRVLLVCCAVLAISANAVGVVRAESSVASTPGGRAAVSYASSAAPATGETVLLPWEEASAGIYICGNRCHQDIEDAFMACMAGNGCDSPSDFEGWYCWLSVPVCCGAAGGLPWVPACAD